MDLAKPALDVGLASNALDEMREFYQSTLGLPFEEMLPIGGGVRQYRFGLNGSVLKLNHNRDAIAPAPTGYRRLVIATPAAGEVTALDDPDGLSVTLVPPGTDGVTHIAIDIAVPDPAVYAAFAGALGAVTIGQDRYRLGTTVLEVIRDEAAECAGPMGARGFRYLTVQVRDVRAELARLEGLGVDVAFPARKMGDVAMIAFIRDPGGNWIEVSQRASLTGPLPD